MAMEAGPTAAGSIDASVERSAGDEPSHETVGHSTAVAGAPVATLMRPTIAPLTEQVLSRLRGRRWLWMVLWAAIPLLSPLIFSSAVRFGGGPFGTREFMDFLATQAGLAFACLVLLWGCGVLGRDAAATRDELIDAVPGAIPPRLFATVGQRRGPLLLTAIAVVITTANGWATYGPVAPLAALPLLFVYMVPIQTFVWSYIAILAGIDRLGGLPIVLDRFPQDRTLGLERIGSLASTGLGLLLVAAIPVLLAGSDEPVTFALSLVIVVGAVGVFCLSMWRLHRQMVGAKARHVATARRLYASAYAPVRANPDVATLTEQATALAAAKALDERAQSLPTWPLDEGTARFVGVLVTGILTSLIVRALFAAIGF